MLPLPCGPRGPRAAGLSDCVRCLFASYKPQSWIKTTTTVLYTSCVEDFVVDFVEILTAAFLIETSLAHLATVLRRGGCSSP
jgi:hypothetical protein